MHYKHTNRQVCISAFTICTHIFFSFSSGNNQHSDSSKLYQKKEIDVKYSIFATIERFVLFYVKLKILFKKLAFYYLISIKCLIRLFSSLSYSNFSHGKNNLQKPLRQSIVVKIFYNNTSYLFEIINFNPDFSLMLITMI